MNRDQARDLVKNTFTHSFEKTAFRNFAINLLNKFDESKAFFCNSTYVKDAFKEHVSRFERLGTYTSPESEKLDVLVVHLTNESKLERARTAIRNFVADHLKQRDNKDAALVAFVSPTEQQWRFSYVKMEYATVQKESGKIGVESRLTPARRFSYIVGEGESCHTAQTRFLKLLQNTENNPTLAHLEDAFSVEAVTKEFFNKYAELFGGLQTALEKLAAKDKAIGDEFKKKSVNTVDFAKKLLGQIVFLYFLQKKGWLGVEKGKDWGTGPHDFLRRLARGEYAAYENFFNDILEPLFYDILATDRGHEAWCKTFKCRIPFLNGGLFEPLGDYNWKKTDISLPNKLFTNSEFVEEGIAGTGVLDVFDRYNFTVNEAEPLEKEVAIDPEMLGKVFENLIEENRRKGLGSYYTPREIVHYMCQESLINFLDTAINSTEEFLVPTKPAQTTLLSDPAPEQVGLKTTVRREVVPHTDLETFVHLGDQISHYEAVEAKYDIKMPKTIEKNARLIDEKLADITVCDPAVGSGAFPVGMMTEIVRARSALTPYFNDVHDRTPYHFKRHAIQNCLYGVDLDSGAVEIAKLRLWLSLVVDEEDVKQIKPLPNLDFKVVSGNSLIGFPFKSQRLERLEQLKARFFQETERERKAELKREIDRELSECFAASKKSLGYEVNFDFEIYFSEVFDSKDGFDVVIGNPPYVRTQELKKADARMADMLKMNYASASKGNYDLYVVFVEKGLQLLNGVGHFAFILPHKFFNAQYGEPLRELISRGQHLHHVVHFGDQQIFEGATNYVCLLFLAKAGAEKCRWVCSDDLPAWLQTFRAPETTLSASCVTAAEWNVVVGNDGRLFDKLQEMPLKLGALADRISQGIRTSANEVYVLDVRSDRGGLVTAFSKQLDGEVVLERNALLRFLSGKEIKSYAILPCNKMVVMPYRIKNSRADLIPLKQIGAEWPKTFAYLNENKTYLRRREDGRFDGSAWHQFGRNQNIDLMLLPKLLVPDIADRAAFAFDEKGVFAFTSGYGITFKPEVKESPKFILGLLNSALLDWFWKRISTPLRGGFYRYFTQFIAQFPIPGAPPEKQKAVERLVDRILAAKRRDSAADTSALEREIDYLVYALYGLTPEEIKSVEESRPGATSKDTGRREDTSVT